MLSNDTIPFWVRRLGRNLIHSDPVEDAYSTAKEDSIKVKYKTGFHRTYSFKPGYKHIYQKEITKADGRLDWPIEIEQQYSWNPLDPAEKLQLLPYFHVSRKVVDDLTYMEREVLVQHLLGTIVGYGYIPPHITDLDIENELERIKNFKAVFNEGIFNFSASTRTGRLAKPIIHKFYDVRYMYRNDERRTFDNAFTTLKIMFVALQHIIHKSRWDINVSAIHRMLSRMKYGPYWINPAIFRVIIKQLFDINDDWTLVDASPNINEKALTAWAIGCKYAAIDGSRPPNALVDRLGIRIVDPQPPYDLVIADNKLELLPTNIISKLIELSKNLVIFVPRESVKELRQQLNPSRIVKAKVSRFSPKQECDYLFIYS